MADDEDASLSPLAGRARPDILRGKGGVSMEDQSWHIATVERGKPRVYIQQFLDLRLPEPEYKDICKKMGLEKPFDEDSAMRVMEQYLEDLDDGSQADAVHIQRGDGIVVLMTVVSYPFKQETFDRLHAAHLAKKALGAAE
jgi:tRNA(His) 5'-end guanylyltransferase